MKGLLIAGTDLSRFRKSKAPSSLFQWHGLYAPIWRDGMKSAEIIAVERAAGFWQSVDFLWLYATLIP